MNSFNPRHLLLLLLLVLPMLAMADDSPMYRIVLRSGQVVVGEVLRHNEEVVIVKDQSGARFQYPAGEVEQITELVASQESKTEDVAEEEVTSRTVSNVKRTSMGFRFAGGVASIGGRGGGVAAADFRLGANNLGGKHIFLGGQVGYRALMTPELVDGKQNVTVLSVIPIDVVMELPLIQGVHVPMIGANIGYGIGVSKIRGGVNAGLSFGYRYQFSRTGAFHLSAACEVQQLAAGKHDIEIEAGQTFTSNGRRTAVMGLLTLGILF